MCNNRKPFRKSVATLFSAALVLTGLTGSTISAYASESASVTVEETPRQTSTVPATPSTNTSDDAPAEVTKPAPPKESPRQQSTTKPPAEKTDRPEAKDKESNSASPSAEETPTDEETEVEPEETEATVTVRIANGLAGVSLRLYSGGDSGPGSAIGESWARCTSNGAGACTFTIPDTHPATDDYEKGDNYDKRFWVVQESAPSGWYANSTLGLGSETPYRFRTGPALRAGKTYSSTSDFMRSQGSSGHWQNSRANPSASLACKPGANIAVILDQSGPIGNAAAAAQSMKKRLDGSRSTVTVLNTTTASGLAQVAQGSYDLAIVVGAGAKASNFAAMEKTIEAANAAKARGTRILAVGVGPTSQANLKAIAGAQIAQSAAYSGADAHSIGIGRLSMLLDSIADQLACETTVEVTQKVTPYGGDATTADDGWTFTLDASKASVTPKATQQTGKNGTVSYDLAVSDRGTDVTINSVLSDQQRGQGWAHQDSTCEINGSKVSTDKAAAKLSVKPGDRVECTFHATQSLNPDLKISKRAWDTDNIGGLADAPELTRGSTVAADTTVTWTYQVTNTGETPLDDIVVTDDQLPDDAVVCPTTTLAAGESMTCTATGVVTADH